MIAAAEILRASLVLDNEPGFNLTVTNFIANTSDEMCGARGNAGQPVTASRSAGKNFMSNRDVGDAIFLPEMKGKDEWLYTTIPLRAGVERACRALGESHPFTGKVPQYGEVWVSDSGWER